MVMSLSAVVFIYTPWLDSSTFKERFLPALTLSNRPDFLKPETPSAKGNTATPA